MRSSAWCLAMTILIGSGCGNGASNGNGDITEVLAYMGLAVGKAWTYEVDVGGPTPQVGTVEVIGIDKSYTDGVDAYELEIRQNQLLVATRWYQVSLEGLFLLGEEVREQSDFVERTFLQAVQVVPYPLDAATQSWRTESDLREGGSETHRFDNSGTKSITVPAGTFDAFHLVHSRMVTGGDTFAYDEYFRPQHAYPQFEYPEDSIWRATE